MKEELSGERLKTLSQERLRKEIDSEVRRVSELFRFILKYRERFQPSGVEFSALREYLPSDDANRIDWKSSARLNSLYVKQFDEERDMDVFVVMDASDTMLFGTADKLKSEYASVMAATLAYASVDVGLNVGLGIYGEDTMFMTPDGGMKQYHAVLNEVTDFDNYGGKFELEEALGDVVEQVRSNTAVFVISDFIKAGVEDTTKVNLVNSKFRHLMSVMVRDRRDYQLPNAGNMRFQAPGGGQKLVVNTGTIADDFNRKALEQEEKVRDHLEGSGSSFLKIDTRDSFAAEFAEFFDKQKGRW